MAAQRQPQYDDPRDVRLSRPRLRLVENLDDHPAAEEWNEERHGAFIEGLKWGIVVSGLGFWLPVAAAMWKWLG